MSSTFSSRRLRRFMPRTGTELAKKQVELETRLKEAVELSEESDEEDVLDEGDGVDGGNDIDMEEAEEGEDEEVNNDEAGEEVDRNDETGDEEEIIGNDLVDEVSTEVEGSFTRRGRHYDGGGHM